MSKFTKIMITLLVIAGFVLPAVAMAEERLSLSGYYTLRGYAKDNVNYDDDTNDSSQYFVQRFRLGGSLAVAEGVSINFRADIAEGTTATAKEDTEAGMGTVTSGASDIGNVQFDIIYATIEKDAYTLSAGQFNYTFANALLIDVANTTAVHFTLKGINLSLMYHKFYEGDEAVYDDVDLYAATWGMASDSFSLDILGGYINAPKIDGTKYGIGAAVGFNLGAFKVKSEANLIDGTYTNATGTEIDVKGLQFFLDGSVAIAETVTLGGVFTYAQAYDGANESQSVSLAGNDFSPENYGYAGTLYSVYTAAGADTFDPTGQSKGVIGVEAYAAFKITDSFGVKGLVAYVQPQEDATNYDSFSTAGVSARYNLAANTSVDVSYSYSTPEAANSSVADDAGSVGFCRLTVAF